MAKVLVEQAIFSSDNNDRVRGYQLVARSAGITPEIGRELVRWSPSHQAILDSELDAQCLLCFPVGDSHVAVGRTVYGLPEYSGRGGRQSATRYIVTTRRHLAGFAGNGWGMWLAARSQGGLQWDRVTESRLPQIPMMEFWSPAGARMVFGLDSGTIHEAARLLAEGRRVGVTGVQNPEKVLRGVLSLVPDSRRSELSFATGLRPSVGRPFDLQVLPKVDRDICAELSSDRVALVRC